MPPMTGRVVAGRYNLQHPIGRGAMGVVWRARDQLLDRDVAVKEVVISAMIGDDERRNAYQRTLREARTAARLSHRGVVAVYDVAEEDGRPWIIMELVPSRSLDQVLSVERRLASLRTGRIGQQLLSALAAAHAAGVLHRDVKPSNVLIATDRSGSGWDERAVLTDFGIAQFEGDPRLTQTGMVMGSPGFTAPERIRGGDATPASDLWSLGATLYAAVEGRGPYEQRGGAITTMSAIINEDAPVAVHAGQLAPVIGALLRREPSSRPSASTAARMFAQVLPQLADVTERSHQATHPATVRVTRAPQPTAMAAPVESAPPVDSAVGDSVSGNSVSAPEPESAAESEPTPSPAPTMLAAQAVETGSAADEPETVPSEAAVSEVAVSEVAVSEVAVPEVAAEAETSGAETGPESAPAPASEPDSELALTAESAPEAELDADAGTGAEADADADADAEMGPDEAEDEDEDAPEPGAAAEAAMRPGDTEDADAPEETGTPEESGAEKAAVMLLEADPSSRGEETMIDRGSAGYRPTQLSIPVAKPTPAPSFTASRPGERAAPTFSAARHAAHPGTAQPQPQPQPAYGAAPPEAAQYGGYQRTTSPFPGPSGQYAGSNGQYAGPSQPHSDLPRQYVPGTGGGRAERGGGPWRWIILVICAAVLAAAIGAGAAFALHHNAGGSGTSGAGTSGSGTGGSGTTADPATGFGSVDALNQPSTAVPAGWSSTQVTASQANSTAAGFAIDVPPGWKVARNGMATNFYGPSGMNFEIDLTRHTYANMTKEARYIERRSSPKFTGYQLLALQEVPVRSTRGALWQFKQTVGAVLTVADDIVFLKPTQAGSQSYAVFIQGPAAGWGSKYLPVFEQILHTFQTMPAS